MLNKMLKCSSKVFNVGLAIFVSSDKFLKLNFEHDHRYDSFIYFFLRASYFFLPCRFKKKNRFLSITLYDSWDRRYALRYVNKRSCLLPRLTTLEQHLLRWYAWPQSVNPSCAETYVNFASIYVRFGFTPWPFSESTTHWIYYRFNEINR